MIVSVLGQTDRRPVVYTLMKLFQARGDTCLISNNTQLRRLIDKPDCEGFFQNIAVFITDASWEEVFVEIEHAPEDFDYIIFDGEWTDKADVCLYVEGYGTEEVDVDILDGLGDAVNLLKLGPGKKSIPYTVQQFNNIEITEHLKTLPQINNRLTVELSKVLAEPLRMPAKDIIKVVSKS